MAMSLIIKQITMNIFKKKLDSSEDQQHTKKMDWIALTDLNQLNEITHLSQSKLVLIFKHSTRCGISRMALKQFENQFELQPTITTYFLDLLNYREVSNEIANRFNIVHQSPQIVLLKEGKVIYSASQETIEAQNLRNFV